MKKLLMLSLFAIGVIAFSSQKSNAQSYEQGSTIAHLGVGIGGGFGLPISISADYGWKEKISLGGIIGYASRKEDLIIFDAKFTNIFLAARGAYHFDLGVDKLDAYAGGLLGYNVASVSLDPDPGPPFNNVSPGGGAVFGVFGGARYGITDKIGGFAELGYGIGSVTVGLTYKIN